MNELNSVNLIGRIVNDPELKYSSNNHPTILLSLANHQSFTRDDNPVEETNFFRVRLWGKTAESLQEYLKKGKQIAVNGKLNQYSFDSPSGDKISVVEVVATNVQLLGSKGNGKKQSSVNSSDN